MAEPRLILIRHAHRDTSDRESDNGLSEKGWEQAYELAKHFAKEFKDRKPRLLSSGKRRCVETLEPISKVTGVKVEIDPLLMEQEHEERSARFQARIERFLEIWKESKEELTVACSHGDWIPAALRELTGEEVDLKKGAWAELVRQGSKVKLRELIQKF
jgi:broad specificity phosphatase PhoE